MCQEDKDAADDVNKFLAEELARACRFNKSHNCFSADLQAFRNSKHVDDAIKQGLKGLGTYAKVQEHKHVFKRVFLGSHRDSISFQHISWSHIFFASQVLRKLEQVGGMRTFVYHICPNQDCAAVFRAEHRADHQCPKCGADRYTRAGTPRKKLYYLPVRDWFAFAWADPDIARYGMKWQIRLAFVACLLK